MLKQLLALCVLGATAACASRSPSRSEPTASALRAAIADTTSGDRIYFAGEVPWPSVLAKDNHPPRNDGAPDGEARVRFIVGTNGRAEPGTIELLLGSDRELGRRLIAAVRDWRFIPAQRLDGVAVRQLVETTVRKRRDETVIDGAPASRPQ
jgi:hypothetical protein